MPRPYHKYAWTDEQDSLIRAVYGSRDLTPVKTLLTYPLFRGYPRYAIKIRAAKIGASQSVKVWSQAEDALLEKHLGNKSPLAITRIFKRNGFARTVIAVQRRAHTLGLRVRRDTYSVRQIMQAMNCGEAKILQLDQTGLLRTYQEHPGGNFHVTPRNWPGSVANMSLSWRHAPRIFPSSYPSSMNTVRSTRGNSMSTRYDVLALAGRSPGGTLPTHEDGQRDVSVDEAMVRCLVLGAIWSDMRDRSTEHAREMQTASFSDVEVAGGAVTPRAMWHWEKPMR